MDGTLVDSEKLWTISLHDTARWLGGTMSPAARDAVVGGDMARTLATLFDDLGLPRDPARMAEAERFIDDRTAELFAGGLPWRPGALEALRLVDGLGWPTALVTNTGRALDRGGAGQHRPRALHGERVRRRGGVRQARSRPYLRAAELLGVAPARCLAVEDSPNGALAAERAGAAVLVVPCDVPVPGGPGRVLRTSLVGLTRDDLQASYAEARGERAA